jgi:acylphosphatase
MASTTFRVRWIGMVQGVGFRALVQRTCRSSGLRGWVRNRADGSVEALLVGDGGKVDQALHSIRAARNGDIESVEIELSDDPTARELDQFEIRAST